MDGLWRLVTRLLVGSALLVGCGSANSKPAAGLTVAAAADLRFAFEEIGPRFEEETGVPVTFVFGSTGMLTQQIENGAPFDVLAAANVAYVEQLADRGLVLDDTIQLYAQGRIVLAVNRESGLEVTALVDLTSPAVKRVAIANPEHAPYGQAAKEALLSAGVWEAVQPKLVLGENVRQTLQFIQTGDAAVGIVALSIADVPEVSYTLIPAELHQPINQAMAVIRTSAQPEMARRFIEFVNGPTGRAIMQRYGFRLPGEF